jgi:TIR domain
MTSIFLSHSWKDKFFVRELAKRLESYGIKVWLDEAELKIGDSLTQKIGQAIIEMDFVGVVLSSNSVNSEWVQRELQTAIQKEFSNRKVVVLPILLEPVEIPPFLRDKVYADFTTSEKFDESFRKLLNALGVLPENIEPIREPQQEKKNTAPVLSQAEQRLATFEDISISDLDIQRSYKPDPEKLLYNMYLKLSKTPPAEWEQIFEAERRFPRHTMWRRAWIEGQHIVINCVPDELEKYHLSDLAEDVKNSNAKYRQFLIEMAQQELKEIDKGETERQKMQELKKRLGFN